MTRNIYYVSRLFDYLGRLCTNNSREWFKSNREEYDRLRRLWLDDLGRLIAAMSEWEPGLRNLEPRRAAYRIYRDTRFSPDKTPYKTYFSASMTPPPDISSRAGYYLQMGPSNDGSVGLFAGIWCPESAVLRKLRTAIVDNIEEWESIVSDPQVMSRFTIFSSSQLKTVPRGYDKNHPQARWLRMKDYGLNAALSPDFFLDPDWPLKASEILRHSKPFVDFLNYSIDE